MAEAIWVDEIRQRTLAERQVYAARMAQQEEFDVDNLPDVDAALKLFDEWLYGDVATEDLSPEDERRLAVGLGRKR